MADSKLEKTNSNHSSLLPDGYEFFTDINSSCGSSDPLGGSGCTSGYANSSTSASISSFTTDDLSNSTNSNLSAPQQGDFGSPESGSLSALGNSSISGAKSRDFTDFTNFDTTVPSNISLSPPNMPHVGEGKRNRNSDTEETRTTLVLQGEPGDPISNSQVPELYPPQLVEVPAQSDSGFSNSSHESNKRDQGLQSLIAKKREENLPPKPSPRSTLSNLKFSSRPVPRRTQDASKNVGVSEKKVVSDSPATQGKSTNTQSSIQEKLGAPSTYWLQSLENNKQAGIDESASHTKSSKTENSQRDFTREWEGDTRRDTENYRQEAKYVPEQQAQQYERENCNPEFQPQVLDSPDGTLKKFVDSNGIVWNKVETEGRAEQRLSLWTSNDGGEQLANVYRDPSGLVVVEDSDGLTVKLTANGDFEESIAQSATEKNAELLVKVFDVVDTDKNDRLSWSELETALTDERFSEEEKVAIRSLQTHYSGIEWRARGNADNHNSTGISLQEYLSIDQTLSTQDDREVLKAIDSIFDYCNTGNRIKHASELQPGLQRIKMPEVLRQSLEILRQRFIELESYRRLAIPTGQINLTKAAFRTIVLTIYKLRQKSLSNSGDEWPILELESHHWSLFGDYGVADPRAAFTGLRTLSEFDQVFLAAVAAVSSRDKDLIRSLIRSTDSDSFFVTFKGPSQSPIRVLQPTQAEVARYGKASSAGVWPLILAEAFSRSQSVAFSGEQSLPSPQSVLEMVTGRPSRIVGMNDLSESDIEATLLNSWGRGSSTLICRFPLQNEHDQRQDSLLGHTCALVGWEGRTPVIASAHAEDGGVLRSWSPAELAKTFSLIITS